METLKFSAEQRAQLRAIPAPAGHPNKIRLALRMGDASAAALARALQRSPTLVQRYVRGGDLLLSTAFTIADAFGLEVCDLWPTPPKSLRPRAKRVAGSRPRNAKSAPSRRATKAAA
jgi:hypothetical protein